MLVGVSHLIFKIAIEQYFIGFLPPNVTNVVQSLHQVIIATFKVQCEEKLQNGFSLNLILLLLTMT